MDHELFIKQLKPSIYLFDEDHSASGYLVVGENKACLIDTMNGYCNLYEAVRKITDKPIIVVNTHGHPDHIFGNVYFDEALIDSKDLELAESFIDEPEFKEACDKYDNVYFIQTNATDSAHSTSVDGSHPNDYGYTLWAESIQKPLLKILRKHGIK
jgi:glyoxylase-like metal-dependent hydrolase (beta-lactamase superfamily II)